MTPNARSLILDPRATRQTMLWPANPGCTFADAFRLADDRYGRPMVAQLEAAPKKPQSFVEVAFDDQEFRRLFGSLPNGWAIMRFQRWIRSRGFIWTWDFQQNLMHIRASNGPQFMPASMR